MQVYVQAEKPFLVPQLTDSKIKLMCPNIFKDTSKYCWLIGILNKLSWRMYENVYTHDIYELISIFKFRHWFSRVHIICIKRVWGYTDGKQSSGKMKISFFIPVYLL